MLSCARTRCRSVEFTMDCFLGRGGWRYNPSPRNSDSTTRVQDVTFRERSELSNRRSAAGVIFGNGARGQLGASKPGRNESSRGTRAYLALVQCAAGRQKPKEAGLGALRRENLNGVLTLVLLQSINNDPQVTIEFDGFL
jgi:hypothetical protein